MASDDIDGRFSQAWGGTAPNGCHVNVVLARRGTATGAAMVTTFTAPSEGFTPVLVCLGPDQPSYETLYPPTIMLNKVATTGEREEGLLFGAAQVGIARGVLDSVAARLLRADQDTLVFVSVWLDPRAESDPAVRDAARAAVGGAIREAVIGRPPAEAARLVELRDQVTHPFYDGEG